MQRDIEIKRETGMMTKQMCDELCIFSLSIAFHYDVIMVPMAI